MESLLLRGAYFFAVALALAHLEIQIEGKDGWAAKLPTWRWQPAWLARPVTGYFVCMNVCLLLFMHLPLMYAGFSAALEGEILAFYFLLTVSWDFLWFVWNRHFGVRGFRRENVWWYRTWLGRVPVDYVLGLAVSAAVYLAPAALGAGAWGRRGLEWGALVAEFAVLTIAATATARLAVRVEGGTS